MAKTIHDKLAANFLQDSDMEELYANYEDPWQHKAAGYSLHPTIARMIKKYLEVNEVNNILDIGCGEGVTLQIFRNWPSVQRMVGVDISKTAIERAGEAFKDDGRFVGFCADIKSVKLTEILESHVAREPIQVDVAIVADVMYYLPNIGKAAFAAHQICECVRPGGIIIVTEFIRGRFYSTIFEGWSDPIHEETYELKVSNPEEMKNMPENWNLKYRLRVFRRNL